jgi:uncharacterized membrane protein (DUF106 family)
MLVSPVINIWVDMIIISFVLAVFTKLIQHVTTPVREYVAIKLRNKEINKEIKELSKQQKMDEVKIKQKEAFSLVAKQFKLTKKSMFVMFIIALPLLWFVKKYYFDFVYNFGLFTTNGLWAYVILGVGISLIINSIYDKIVLKKYMSKDI